MGGRPERMVARPSSMNRSAARWTCVQRRESLEAAPALYGAADRGFQRIEAFQQDGAIGVLAGCERIEDAAQVAFFALHFVDQARGGLLFGDETGGVGFDKAHRIDGDPSGGEQDQHQEREASVRTGKRYRPDSFSSPIT